ncbi:MAG: hypothetical protein U0667_04140 [Chloroflexota bacterium]
MRSLVARLRGWDGMLLVILLVVVGWNALMAPGYLGVQNQVNLLQLGIEKAIVVLAMTFASSSATDLSVASVMGLAGVVGPGCGPRACQSRSASWRPCSSGSCAGCSTGSSSRSWGCRRWP